MKADRPPWYLSVICGALLRTIQQVNLRSADYLGFLEKGQLPPAKLTLTSFEQQLVLEGVLFQCFGLTAVPSKANVMVKYVPKMLLSPSDTTFARRD